MRASEARAEAVSERSRAERSLSQSSIAESPSDLKIEGKRDPWPLGL